VLLSGDDSTPRSASLADLGLSTIRLRTNHPRKVMGLDAFGIEIVEQVPVGTEVA